MIHDEFILYVRFHSTDFPSEWGLAIALRFHELIIRFHSTDFPSEWGLPQRH